jgi:RNA polymerase-binding transcription factor DksA
MSPRWTDDDNGERLKEKHMGWIIYEDGLTLEGQPHYDEKKIRGWLRDWLRAPNRPGQICHEIELVMEKGFVDAATIMRASKWAHWAHSSQYLARKVLMELFGHVPRRFLDQKNEPISSWDEVAADYEKWRQAVAEKLPRTDNFPLDPPQQATSHWMDIRRAISERIKRSEDSDGTGVAPGGVTRLCEKCGKTIPAERLEIRPNTTICVKCSQEAPQREEDS